jgi:hypothetical protein
MEIWVAGLIGQDTRAPYLVVVRSVIMAVDPELGLAFLNQFAEIRD